MERFIFEKGEALQILCAPGVLPEKGERRAFCMEESYDAAKEGCRFAGDAMGQGTSGRCGMAGRSVENISLGRAG